MNYLSNRKVSVGVSTIEIKDLYFSYDNGEKRNILNNINISIPKGEFLVVLGSNGSGKTTLLHLLAGILEPIDGVITIDEKPVDGPGINRGAVFQHYSLFPWMTAKENIVFGLKQLTKTLGKDDIDKKAEEYLTLVGLNKDANTYPLQMSNGMQQRVAIARAFAMDTEILLLDEPFSALDVVNKNLLQKMLTELWQRDTNRKTIVLITHDIDEAIVLADRIIAISSEGKIEKDVNIKFSRPRKRNEIIQTQEYYSLRNELISIIETSCTSTILQEN